MRPMITGDPLLVDSFDADHHIVCLHNEDLRNADHLDAVLRAAGYYNNDHHDADPRNSDPQDADPHNVNCRSRVLCDADPCNANPHNANPCNAGSREPPLKGIASEGDDRARGTDIDCFKALNAGEENRLDYVTRDLAEVELAGAAGSVRPRSKRSRCWAL
jgi:uncharacterized protein YjbI with pentapeptide repeats